MCVPAVARAAVLVVKGESGVAQHLQRNLNGIGYDVLAVAGTAEEALTLAAGRNPAVVLVDLKTKGRTDGIKIAQLLQKRFGAAVIYLTADADDVTVERARRAGPDAHLLKSVKPAELKSAMESALVKLEAARLAPEAPTGPQAGRGPAPPAKHGRGPAARAVRRSVEQLFASADFDASRRSREFLRFTVEETLAGRGDELTQTEIATRVFGRKEDFDAVVDPIVRIQAGRLRRSLERYYLLSGKQDPVQIELPRGTYVPVFRPHAAEEPAAPESRAPPLRPVAGAGAADGWPEVAIRPFDCRADADATAERVNEELVLELTRYRDVRVLLEREMDEPASHAGARFSLRGRVRAEESGFRVTAQVVDRVTGEQVWGDEYGTAAGPGRWSGTPDDIGRVIAARVGAEEGVVIQMLANERRKARRAAVTPYGAMLMAYEFFLARDPAMLVPALEALRKLVHEQPECAPAWTRLARLCLANHAFEVTTISTPLDEALTYAQRGVRVDPTSRQARSILAAILLVKGELDSARDELEEVLRLCPDSLVYLEVIGYFLALLGDGERGPALIRKARERNPHSLPNATMGLWFDHLRRGEVAFAYRYALEYRDPTFFWRSVMRLTCLGLLGRVEEARGELADLLRDKPDFQARGRILIGHYVKLPEVMDRVLEGFERVGLKLAGARS